MTEWDGDGRSDHELALAGVFVKLADALVGDLDVEDVMLRLTEHCVDLLATTACACGVLLTDARGALKVLAASPHAAAVLELLQVQVDEGPWVDCVHSGESVRSGDLAADGHVRAALGQHEPQIGPVGAHHARAVHVERLGRDRAQLLEHHLHREFARRGLRQSGDRANQ